MAAKRKKSPAATPTPASTAAVKPKPKDKKPPARSSTDAEHVKIERKYWTTAVVCKYLKLCAQSLIPRRVEGLPHTIIFGNRFPMYLYQPRLVKLYAKLRNMPVDLAAAEALYKECAAEWET